MEPTQINELLFEAATLLVTGMAVVFVFLTILIFSVKLMTKLCLAFPESQTQRPAPAMAAPKPTTQSNDDTLVAIKAAVDAYRQGNTSRS